MPKRKRTQRSKGDAAALDAAQAAQYAQPDGVEPAERAAWNAIRDAAVADTFTRHTATRSHDASID